MIFSMLSLVGQLFISLRLCITVRREYNCSSAFSSRCTFPNWKACSTKTVLLKMTTVFSSTLFLMVCAAWMIASTSALLFEQYSPVGMASSQVYPLGKIMYTQAPPYLNVPFADPSVLSIDSYDFCLIFGDLYSNL